MMLITRTDKRTAFRELCAAGCFVLPQSTEREYHVNHASRN
jgi:hypothetical protein